MSYYYLRLYNCLRYASVNVVSSFPITRVLQPSYESGYDCASNLDSDYNLDLLILDRVNFIPIAELIPLIARAKAGSCFAV